MTDMPVRKESEFRANIISNYASKLFSIISLYVFIPFYIKYLGSDNYALIAFQSVILSFVFIADSGLSSTFTRQCAANQNKRELILLLKTMEKILFFILMVICSFFVVFSDWISTYWLGFTDKEQIINASLSLKIIGLSLIPQVMMSLYFGGLMGLEKQTKANVITITYSMVRSGLVIIPISFFNHIHIYFLWYFLSSSIFCFIFRFYILTELKQGEDKACSSVSGIFLIKKVMPFSLGMLFLSIISAANNQLDKLFVSHYFSLIEFSSYNLASIMSQAPYLLCMPLAVAALPRITKLIHTSNSATNIYSLFSFYISTLSTTACLSILFYLPSLVKVWLGEGYLSTSIVSTTSVLTIGSLFLCYQLMPFQLSISKGVNATFVRLGVLNIIFYLLAIYPLSKHFGLIGATYPWVIINVVNFLFMGVVINGRFYEKGYKNWFFYDCLIPFSISIFFTTLGYFISKSVTGDVTKLFIGFLFGGTSLFFSYRIRGF